MRRAVIDVGSNSVTTTVAEWDQDGWRDRHGSAAVTRLGEGTSATGLLAEANIQSTLDAIRVAWTEAEAQGADVVAVGTAALRMATNREDFLRRAARQGTPVSILSGEEEVRWGERAILDDPTFAGRENLTILDIGGQSTELNGRSIPIGTLKIRSLLLDQDPNGRVPTPALFAASTAVDNLLSPYCPADQSSPNVVAMGGGPGMIVAIREGLTAWDDAKIHAATLTYEEVGRLVGWLMPMSDVERAAVIPLQPRLGRTLHACALILERTLYALRAESCQVSTRGWRHALLADDQAFAAAQKA